MFVFDQSEPVRIELPVSVGSASFVLFLDPPTAEQRISDDGLSFSLYFGQQPEGTDPYKTRYLSRLNNVVGWDGVTDAAGQSIAFSPVLLNRMLAKYPSVINVLAGAFAKLYAVDDATLGESGASPSDSPTVNQPSPLSPLPATAIGLGLPA